MRDTLSGYRSIWKTAYPIIIGLVAQNLMVAIDTAFLGQLGEVTLGAAAIGGIFYLSLVMLGSGFAVGTQILIGRRNGEKKYRSIGRIFDHALYVMLLLAAAVFVILTFLAPHYLGWFLKSDAVLQESLLFLQYRRFGIFFGFINLCFNAFYIGTIRTAVLSVSTIIMALANVFLDYCLIFGNLGFPEMGIAGAALATNLAEFLTFLFFLGFVWAKKHIPRYRMLQFWRPHKKLYTPLFKVASPVMFQYFFSFSAWFVFFMIIEQIGETALAASNITRSIYMLLMIPVWGLSSATNTLVSNTIGQGRVGDVLPLVKKVLIISLMANLLAIQALIFLPEALISFFTDDPILILATIPLLRVISLALIAFSASMIVFSALSGTGKTMAALRIEMVSIAFYLICALVLAVVFNASATMVWSVEIVYFSMLGVISYIYLHKGNWKHHIV